MEEEEKGIIITAHLLTGDPNGIQTVEMDNLTIKMIVFPKSELATVKKDVGESSNPALYMLLGEDENESPLVYIGETFDGYKRIQQHKNKKSFWNKCLMFVSKDNSLDKGDVEYLERRAIELANECARYEVTNEQLGKQNSLNTTEEVKMKKFFNNVRVLTSFVGCTVFENAEKKKDGKVSNLFHLKIKSTIADAYFNENDNSMTITKGSILSKKVVQSYRDEEKRNAILKSIAKKTKDGNWELKKNHTLNSPSSAANFCSGSQVDGWRHWKNDEGKTLDEVYRTEQ